MASGTNYNQHGSNRPGKLYNLACTQDGTSSNLNILTSYRHRYKLSVPVFNFSLLMFLLLQTSCTKSGFFVKTGDIVTSAVSLTAFNEIELHDRVNLVLTYDSVETTVKIEAGENIIPYIETVVKDRRLVIRDNSRFRWTRDLDYKVTVYITTSDINKLEYHGAGNITSTNTLRMPSFVIDSWTGTGSVNLLLEATHTEVHIRKANADVTLKGKSMYTRIYCADHGSFNLLEFPSAEIHMDYRSIRNAHLYATELITARILYKGNVYLKGSARIDPYYTSSGLLIPIP